MRIVIVGVGKIGSALVEKFSGEKHDIIVVDVSSTKVDDIVNRYDVLGIVGSGCNREVLEEAEVSKADFLIASTQRDEHNLLCCAIAKKMGVKRTLARVRDPEYYSQKDVLQETLDLDLIFNPEFRTAQRIARILQFPFATSVDSFAGGRVSLVEIAIKVESPLVGHSVADVIKHTQSKVLFALVTRDGKSVIPRGDYVFMAGDSVDILGTDSEISAFCKKLHMYKQRARSVFVVGGGMIALYLAGQLSTKGVSLKIIEKDLDRCNRLAEALPHVSVLHGNGADQTVLDEEELARSYACVTLTGVDEENVMIGLYAHAKHVDKVITKVDHAPVMRMGYGLGLDTIVCPYDIISDQIVQFVRANKANVDAGINSLYNLHDRSEALEFVVTEDFAYTGISLERLRLRTNILIGCIVRDNEFILPQGSSTLEVGDKVVVITAEARKLDSLKQIVY